MPQPDIEEITPNHFLVRDGRANTLLKGEGELIGNRFTLTSWRRDGLLARLRERGFRVLALEDRIAALPAPPKPPPLGAPIWYPLATAAERLSRFDGTALQWLPIASEQRGGVAGVMLRPGWPVRRRRGRGPAEFALVPERAGAGLRSLSEQEALLIGYAQAAAAGPLALTARHTEEGLVLPAVELPPAYRELLARLAERHPEGLLVDDRAWPFVEALFARLGVRLTARRGG